MTNLTNTEIKAYFIDLDGTLLDAKDQYGKKAISQTNLDAISKAQKEGKTIVVSTGRGLESKDFLTAVNSPYAVLANGAIVVVKDKIVRHLKLSVRDVLLVHDYAWKNQLALKIDSDTTAFGAISWSQKYIAKICGFKPVEHYNFEMHKEHTKVVAWGKLSKKKMTYHQAKLQELLPNTIIVSSTHGYTLEITHIDATKGKGDEFIYKKYLNLPIEQTAHLGDTMNDSTAVGFVGQMIAMENADKNLKSLTPFRGPHYKKAGVAKVLQGDVRKVDLR